MQDVFIRQRTRKNHKKNAYEFKEEVSTFIFTVIFKLIFGIVIFPYVWFTAGRKAGGLLIALGLFIHEKKEFKPSQIQLDRYPNIPRKGSWTNPDFLSEKEKQQYAKKRFFFPEG